MEKHHLTEFVVPALFVALLFVFFDPLMLFMPKEIVMLALGSLVLLFALFATFVWHEVARDEREVLHRMFASRLAFLAGSGALTIGVAYEVFYLHHVDPWLLLSLGAMVAAKAGGSLYAALNR